MQSITYFPLTCRKCTEDEQVLFLVLSERTSRVQTGRSSHPTQRGYDGDLILIKMLVLAGISRSPNLWEFWCPSSSLEPVNRGASLLWCTKSYKFFLVVEEKRIWTQFISLKWSEPHLNENKYQKYISHCIMKHSLPALKKHKNQNRNVNLRVKYQVY